MVTIRNGRFNNCIFHIPQTKGSTIGATVTPLFNRSKNSRIGKTVDILAVLATVFGIVPSVGIGAQQIAGGLSYLFPSIHNTLLTQLVLIAIFAVLYLTSAQTGLDRGIKYLSNLNFSLAGILLVSFLFLGPTVFIMKYFTSTLGSYIGALPSMGLNLGAFNEKSSSWIENWTIFYWGWWISWSPFVGTFIARISKGRTIKEFIFGVVLVPTLICTFWFAVFGGTAIHMEMFQSLGIADEIAKMVQRLDYLLLFHIYHSLHFNDYRVNFSSHIFRYFCRFSNICCFHANE